MFTTLPLWVPSRPRCSKGHSPRNIGAPETKTETSKAPQSTATTIPPPPESTHLENRKTKRTSARPCTPPRTASLPGAPSRVRVRAPPPRRSGGGDGGGGKKDGGGARPTGATTGQNRTVHPSPS